MPPAGSCAGTRPARKPSGYNQDEVLGKPIEPLLADDAVAGGFDTIVQRVFNRRRISGLDLKLRTRQGTIRRFLCRLLPVYDVLGQIEACAFMAADVTAQHHLEQTNRELDAGNHLIAGLTSACSFAINQDAGGTCWLQRNPSWPPSTPRPPRAFSNRF